MSVKFPYYHPEQNPITGVPMVMQQNTFSDSNLFQEMQIRIKDIEACLNVQNEKIKDIHKDMHELSKNIIYELIHKNIELENRIEELESKR